MLNKFSKTKAGFTIIETMISISVFLVVVMVGMDALLNANVIHQKSQDVSSVLDSLSFAMEDMSRNIRTGYNYHCGDFASIESPKSCSLGGNIFFESATGITGNTTDQLGYKIESAGAGQPYNIFKTSDGGSTWVQLNTSEVAMQSFSGFSVLGAEAPASSDTGQPFVIIKLSGTITYKNVTTPFSLQTSVSQRLLDR